MIDNSVMEKLIHVPDEEEQMEELINDLSEEGFVVTNFSKGGIFYILLRVCVHVGIELKQLAVNMINSVFMTRTGLKSVLQTTVNQEKKGLKQKAW